MCCEIDGLTMVQETSQVGLLACCSDAILKNGQIGYDSTLGITVRVYI